MTINSGDVVAYTSADGDVVAGVVHHLADENALGESDPMKRQVWCHWLSDGTGQYAKGEWRPKLTWVPLKNTRLLREDENRDEIFASYAAWRLTQ